jgi:DNA-binding transcriptional ArsR family regulator
VSLLERLARAWRRRWVAGVTLATVATTLLVGAAAHRTLAVNPVIPGVVAGLGIGLALVRRRRRVDALAIARHLNRVVTALEESADLLVLPEAGLTPLERLQRTRVERTLRGLVEVPPLPQRALRLAGAYAITASLLAAGLLQGRPAGARSGTPTSTSSSAPAPRPPRVADVQVSVRPPAYTRRPVRRYHTWDLDAEQGARVTWRLRTDRPVTGVFLLTVQGDTIRGRARGSGEYEATLEAEHAVLYQAVLRDGNAMVASDFHRLAVIPDAPPTLTVVRPEPRTEIAFGAPLAVPLEVLAADDYGVADARIVATVTTGSGEGVKFRERVLEFDTRTPRRQAHGLLLRASLDLGLLGMRPGDELYFHVAAHDTRAPRANETRSETYFISLTDTARVLVADWSGLGVHGVPEYLRSQRQIIIDTERLLGEAAQLATAEFRSRSNNIGIDQHLLRERYGELVGEETVEAGPEPTIEHEHDIEENATLLAQSVKSKLQAALAQMWDAELRLRTGDPRAALPYEYRALELLKQAQEFARAYVLRVGFEPPPLEPDRTRLTGTLTAIGNPSRTRAVTLSPTLPALRAGLDIVRRLRSGGPRRDGDVGALEQAGREVGRLAIDQPSRHLETLRELRLLIASVDSGGTVCSVCLLRVERGIWRALPAPEPAQAGRRSDAGLARRYFELLRDGSPP